MPEHQDREKEQSVKKINWKYICIALLFIICVIAILLSCIMFVHRENARRILKEAKLAQFAVRTIGMEYYGTDKSVYDPGASDGLAKGAAEEISSLTGNSGKVQLRSWNQENMQPGHLIYIKDGFVVEYIYNDGKDNWNVYVLKHVISHF